MERRLKRGDLWTVSGGAGYAGKPRPALIIQDDSFGETASVTYCPLTSFEIDAPYFRIDIEPDQANGLGRKSYVMVDKVTTLPRERFGTQIGILGFGQLFDVDQALLTFLGLLD